MQPLNNIRVLDLSRVYAAPAGSMLLADLGAEVIRVEHPDGSDSMRDWGPFLNEQSTYYLCANRNKKSITLDLKTDEDKEKFKELVKDADIILENFKTGDMERMGLSYEELKKINPQLIYCAVTGFGQTGPLAYEPGFDPVIQAMSGLMHVTGATDGEATRVGVPIADILTSHYVVISILSALRMRDITNNGQFIDLALLDVQMSSLANVASAYLNTGFASERLGNRHNNVAPYQVFNCADGPLMICVGTDGQFQKFCTMLERQEWATDARFITNTMRKQHEVELVQLISDITITKTRDEWIALLQQYKIPGGRVNSIAEALEQPQVMARDMIGEIEHKKYGKIKFVKNPLQFSNLNIQYKLAPPILGEHTNEFQKSSLPK
ncbi:CoA transferase [Lysinibacillus sphaericus]|uniref:CoA transferase n=1 Tax=Lysinibacillus sphaericus TaxID=1421 RepID=A0A2S0K2X0_LYSSH|nr:CoA transferase [Lysinibacillus sphaericus]AVK97720.1 CoA transferase [Lysinibacillus sphaericus]MCS1382959.1 CoA transferase [Lysinibacillus sphaericus]MED4543202.1 CoA transferase [Lysinibacillus sphaericus]TKI20953.1 CoA transferase [Lysinibacillus sphaericus]SUV16358.1 L-carnitine dehydratase/bile acid-inducible protein F [Lysinibacillus sphaericus]